jgi:transposase
MLKMNQYELIKTAKRVYGKSIHGIAREYGHSRNTIRKAIRGVGPKYERRKAPVSPVMDPYRAVILEWLKSDLDAPKKQRHTAHRVYTRLLEEYEFSGAESTVRRYVRLLKIEEGLYKREAFIPLEVDAGKEAEVDWGKALVIIGGEKACVPNTAARILYGLIPMPDRRPSSMGIFMLFITMGVSFPG